MENIETTRTIVDIANKVLTAGAAVFAATVGARGLNAWKKQLKGKTDYDIARNYLKCVYKIREAIKNVRHPAMWASEISQAEKKYDLNDKSTYMGSSKAVYTARFEKLTDAFTELETISFEAEISWGKEAQKVAFDLHQCANKLQLEVSKYLSERTEPSKVDSDIIYCHPGNDNDVFSLKINAAIHKIEEYLKPHLK